MSPPCGENKVLLFSLGTCSFADVRFARAAEKMDFDEDLMDWNEIPESTLSRVIQDTIQSIRNDPLQSDHGVEDFLAALVAGDDSFLEIEKNEEPEVSFVDKLRENLIEFPIGTSDCRGSGDSKGGIEDSVCHLRQYFCGKGLSSACV